MKITINDKCSGCKLCLKSCPYSAIEMVDKQAIINYRCTMCGACLNVCKSDAIVIEDLKKRAPKVSVDSYRGVWVFIETQGDHIAPVSLELISKGRELAETLDVGLTAVIIGAGVKKMAQDLIDYGPSEVIVVDKPVLAAKDEEMYSDVLEALITKDRPEVLLAGATAFGRSLIPRVAARLETGLTADCTELAIDEKNRLLLQTRPAFGGNIMATIICEDRRPQIATVRPHVFKAGAVKNPKGTIRIEDVKDVRLATRIEHIDLVKHVLDQLNFADADIIVSGGRGLKGKQGFEMIGRLADVLGAAVGASRAAVDSGWIGYSHQVGQTGKTVAPKIYIACGISGAVQHLAGMQTSDCIIAINKDANAPIFDVAHYGVVGDVFEIVPKLIETIKRSTVSAPVEER